MLFKVTKLQKSYGDDAVLKEVSFQINFGEKVGLVGRNGAGKTTVLRLITGEETPDGGSIEKINGLRIGMLDQHVDFSTNESVHTAALSAFKLLHDIEAEMRSLEERMKDHADQETLDRYADLQHRFESNGGFEYTARAEAVLIGLGFEKESWNEETANLSGGQKNRLGMVRLLLSDSNVLLLDEPTNHLDVNAVTWLEDYLETSDLSFVVISHDRYFLDKTCSRIIDIENGRAYSYTGNYSQYVAQAELRRDQQQRAFENQRDLINKTEAFIRKNLAGQKTKQAKSRRNQLERMDRLEAPPADTGGGNFALKDVTRTGSHVLTSEKMRIGYPGNSLAEDIDFILLRGDRLGVIGGNGSGKTTFLKTLLGDLSPLEGDFRWGTKTEIGYYSQQLEELEPSNEVINEFRKVAPLAENGEIRGFLARFLFFGDDVFKRVGDLSGGEKGRLSLAKLVYSSANVLLLDEPTNHLDIPSREALEEALTGYPGTIIVVSHDRYFLDRIINRILDFSGGGETELYDGNYSEYRIKFGTLERALPVEPEAVSASLEPEVASTNLSKNEIRKVKTRIEAIEGELPELEGELASIGVRMTDPEVAGDPEKLKQAADEYAELENRIKSKYVEWEELIERLN